MIHDTGLASISSYSHCSPLNPILSSLIDYRTNAILRLMLYSRETVIAHSINYGISLYGQNVQLYILIIYENVMFIRHFDYFN